MRGGGLGRRGERVPSSAAAASMSATPKAKVNRPAAWREARELVWAHKDRLLLGLLLMLVSRVAGLVLPASSKWLIDEVVGKNRTDLLMPIALATSVATFVQAGTSFVLSQILGVAAQRAITDMRKRVQARVMHCLLYTSDAADE